MPFPFISAAHRNYGTSPLLLNIHQIGGEALAVFTGEARRRGGVCLACGTNSFILPPVQEKVNIGWPRAG